MKKLISVILVFALCFSLCATAFATDAEPDSNALAGELSNYDIGYYRLKVPADWARNEEFVYPEIRDGNAYAMLFGSSNEIEEPETNKNDPAAFDDFVTAFGEGLDKAEIVSEEEIVINGITMRRYDIDTIIQGTDGLTNLYLFWDDISGDIVSVVFFQAKAAEKNYTEDYKRVMESIEAVEATPVFPVLLSTLSNLVGSGEYNHVLTMVKDAKVSFETTAPSEEDMGEITVEDDNGFQLTLYFYPDKANLETLALVSYSDGSYEGSVSDEFHIAAPACSIYDINADPKQTKVDSIEEVIRFIAFDVPERRAEYEEAMKDTEEIEVTVDISGEMQDGKAFFTVKTNLPDETNLMVSVENSSGYSASTKVAVSKGTAKTEGFSNKGIPLSGKYTVRVTMPLPTTQPESVTARIGSKGEFLTGSLVEKSDIGSSNIVRASFEVQF